MKHDNILDVLHNTAQGLHAAGLLDNATMRQFDANCLPEVHEYTAEQIKELLAY